MSDVERDHKFNARLARRISDFWARQGYAVALSVERGAYDGHATMSAVRSDMINGVPRKRVAVDDPRRGVA